MQAYDAQFYYQMSMGVRAWCTIFDIQFKHRNYELFQTIRVTNPIQTMNSCPMLVHIVLCIIFNKTQSRFINISLRGKCYIILYTYTSSLLGRSIWAIFYLLTLYIYTICLYFTARMLGTNKIYIFKRYYSEIVMQLGIHKLHTCI